MLLRTKKTNMKLKVKGTPELLANKKSVRVIVETADGEEYEFYAKTEDALDESIFKSLLHTWARMIQQKKAQAELKEEDVKKILEKRAKAKIED